MANDSDPTPSAQRAAELSDLAVLEIVAAVESPQLADALYRRELRSPSEEPFYHWAIIRARLLHASGRAGLTDLLQQLWAHRSPRFPDVQRLADVHRALVEAAA